MATKRDLENILDDIETLLKAQYNTKLTAIDTEKADGITLAPVATGAYFMQTLNNTVANFNPFIFYGVEQIEPRDGIGPATASRYLFNIVLALADGGNDPDYARRLFRYSRALQEVFEENFAKISHSSKFRIETLEPVPLKLINSSQPYRAVGVKLDFEGVL